MFPELLGPLPVYLTSLVIAAVGGSALTIWQAHRERVPLGRFAVLQAATVVAAFVGMKLYAIAERGGGFHGLAWEAGSSFRYPGGILAAALILPILTRALVPGLGLARLADMVAVSISVVLVFARLGCFAAGCCHGVTSELPWAVLYPAYSPAWDAHLGAGLIGPESVASASVHPLPLYFGLASLGLAVFLFWFRSRQRYAGQLFLIFLLIDGTAKLLLEFLRFDYALHLQWMAFGEALLGGAILLAKALWDRRAVERWA